MNISKYFILFYLFLFILLADEKSFIREYTYEASWFEKKENARWIALTQVKKILLEEIGVYIKSEFTSETKSNSNNGHYNIEELDIYNITSITAGITKTEIIDETWKKNIKSGTYWLKAKITLDPDDILTKIDEVIDNKTLSANLKKATLKTETALAEIEYYKLQLSKANTLANTLKEELIEKYNTSNKMLTIIDFTRQGYQTFMNKNYDQTIDLFNSVLSYDSLNANAYFYIGLSKLAQKQDPWDDFTYAGKLDTKIFTLDKITNYPDWSFNKSLANNETLGLGYAKSETLALVYALSTLIQKIKSNGRIGKITLRSLSKRFYEEEWKPEYNLNNEWSWAGKLSFKDNDNSIIIKSSTKKAFNTMDIDLNRNTPFVPNEFFLSISTNIDGYTCHKEQSISKKAEEDNYEIGNDCNITQVYSELANHGIIVKNKESITQSDGSAYIFINLSINEPSIKKLVSSND